MITTSLVSSSHFAKNVRNSADLRHENEALRPCTVCKQQNPGSLLSLLLVGPYYGTEEQRLAKMSQGYHHPFVSACQPIPYCLQEGELGVGLHELCKQCYLSAAVSVGRDKDSPPYICAVVECDNKLYKLQGTIWELFSLSYTDYRKQ